MISAETVARASADGYTLLLATGTHTISPNFFKLSYDMTRDFAPVTLLGTIPFVLTVHPSVPVKSVDDLIKLARARPGELEEMPCAAAASERIQASVRPAIGMPRKASGTPKSSSKARAIARPPAPPVSTRVPSMSKRISVDKAQRSAFAAHLAGSGSFRRWFFLEADTLPFVELVEAAFDRAAMKEPLLPALVADESEPSVPNEPLDSTGRHPSLPGRVGAQRDPNFTFRSSGAFVQSGRKTDEHGSSS